MALSATGCSSGTTTSAAGQSTATSRSTSAAPSAADTQASAASSASGNTSVDSGTQTHTAAGHATTSKGSPNSKSSYTGDLANIGSCDNSKLTASLAPRTASQKSSVYVIAVKNTGSICDINYLPYVWITAGPAGNPPQARPLIPDGLGGGPNPIEAGQTFYAAIDLDPQSASGAIDGYTYLEVTADPERNTSGKDVQDLQLPAPAKVSGAQLGTYTGDVASAIQGISGASVPEK